MKIILASDHAGVELRRQLIAHLGHTAHTIIDNGPATTESIDYPDYAYPLCKEIQDDSADLGILICGTGIGMSMCANKVEGIRAALCTDEFSARATRAHNDANILCLGSRVVGSGLALAIADAFIETKYEAGRHQRRLDKIKLVPSKQSGE